MKEFTQLVEDNPNLSTTILFCRYVRGKQLARPTFLRHFNVMVDKEDYKGSSKKELLAFLWSKNNEIQTA